MHTKSVVIQNGKINIIISASLWQKLFWDKANANILLAILCSVPNQLYYIVPAVKIYTL